jgi:hypothetical protein
VHRSKRTTSPIEGRRRRERADTTSGESSISITYRVRPSSSEFFDALVKLVPVGSPDDLLYVGQTNAGRPTVYLMRKIQMNGEHAEIFTFHLKVGLLTKKHENGELAPFGEPLSGSSSVGMRNRSPICNGCTKDTLSSF